MVNNEGFDSLVTLMNYFRVSQQTKTPKIICLCGSTRFYNEFQQANYLETLRGNIILTVGFYPHATNEMHGENVGITSEQKQQLDLLHLKKIDLADEILVLNVGGYIGESTAREILYANMQGKVIKFLERNNYVFGKPDSWEAKYIQHLF